MEILVKSAVAQGMKQLKEAGILENEIDSWLLAEDILGVGKKDVFLKPEICVSKEMAKKYFDAVEMRMKHMPLQQITGHQQFMDFDFIVNENVLIPRPETELLVEQVVSYVKGQECVNFHKKNCSIKVLDMCTGSGCIAISVDKMCANTDVTAVDISDKALEVARQNNFRNQGNVTFVKSNLFENIKEKYDIIISNPPYTPTGDIDELMDEVKDHEPHLALDGSDDGLKFYREIGKQAMNYFNENGKIFLEIGYDQGKTVPDLLKKNGFSEIQVLKDLSGNDRMVIAGKE